MPKIGKDIMLDGFYTTAKEDVNHIKLKIKYKAQKCKIKHFTF